MNAVWREYVQSCLHAFSVMDTSTVNVSPEAAVDIAIVQADRLLAEEEKRTTKKAHAARVRRQIKKLTEEV